MKYKNNHYGKLNLQIFADDGSGSGDGDGGGAGGDDGSDPDGDNGNEPVSFDDFLKGEGNQAEFDRRMQKAIDTAVTNAQSKWQALTDNKLTEAEKLAKMNREQKAEYKASKLEKQLEDMERKNALVEMSKTARKLLADEEINISDDLLSHLVSADAADTKASVESFAKMYKGAVQEAVKDALKGNPPKVGTGGKATVTRAQIDAIKNPSERQSMIAQHMDLYQ